MMAGTPPNCKPNGLARVIEEGLGLCLQRIYHVVWHNHKTNLDGIACRSPEELALENYFLAAGMTQISSRPPKIEDFDNDGLNDVLAVLLSFPMIFPIVVRS